MTLDINTNHLDTIGAETNNNLFLGNKDYINTWLDHTRASINSFVDDIIRNKWNNFDTTAKVGNISLSYSEENPTPPKKPSVDENLSSVIINKDISSNALNNQNNTPKKKANLFERFISLFRKKEEDNIKKNNELHSLSNVETNIDDKEAIIEDKWNVVETTVKTQVDNIIASANKPMTMEDLIKEYNPSWEKWSEIKFITKNKPTAEELEMKKIQDEKDMEKLKKSLGAAYLKKYLEKYEWIKESYPTMDEYLKANNIDNNPKEGWIKFIDKNSDIYKEASERSKAALKIAKRLRDDEISIA